GNTTVEFLSTATSTRVWRLRSCSASGWAIITSEACASSPAASASPCAAMILARFSRSASAWRAIARCMLPGQLDIPQLDDGDLDPPLLGLHVEDLGDVLIDRIGLRQRLIERMPPHHCPQRRKSVKSAELSHDRHSNAHINASRATPVAHG